MVLKAPRVNKADDYTPVALSDKQVYDHQQLSLGTSSVCTICVPPLWFDQNCELCGWQLLSGMNRSLALLVWNLEKKLEMITKWLKGSGLVVNESKTEVCKNKLYLELRFRFFKLLDYDNTSKRQLLSPSKTPIQDTH